MACNGPNQNRDLVKSLLLSATLSLTLVISGCDLPPSLWPSLHRFAPTQTLSMSLCPSCQSASPPGPVTVAHFLSPFLPLWLTRGILQVSMIHGKGLMSDALNTEIQNACQFPDLPVTALPGPVPSGACGLALNKMDDEVTSHRVTVSITLSPYSALSLCLVTALCQDCSFLIIRSPKHADLPAAHTLLHQ